MKKVHVEYYMSDASENSRKSIMLRFCVKIWSNYTSKLSDALSQGSHSIKIVV